MFAWDDWNGSTGCLLHVGGDGGVAGGGWESRGKETTDYLCLVESSMGMNQASCVFISCLIQSMCCLLFFSLGILLLTVYTCGVPVSTIVIRSSLPTSGLVWDTTVVLSIWS